MLSLNNIFKAHLAWPKIYMENATSFMTFMGKTLESLITY